MSRKLLTTSLRSVRPRARPAPPPPRRPSPKLALVERPADRFERSIETHKLETRYRELRARRASSTRRRRGPCSSERPRRARQLRTGIDVPRERVARPSAGQGSSASRTSASPRGVSQSTLDAIAACESGGDPTAVDSSGTYYGKYQFDTGTWASVGGSGNPAAASRGRAGLPRLAALQPRRLEPLAGLRRLTAATRFMRRPRLAADEGGVDVERPRARPGHCATRAAPSSDGTPSPGRCCAAGSAARSAVAVGAAVRGLGDRPGAFAGRHPAVDPGPHRPRRLGHVGAHPVAKLARARRFTPSPASPASSPAARWCSRPSTAAASRGSSTRRRGRSRSAGSSWSPASRWSPSPTRSARTGAPARDQLDVSPRSSCSRSSRTRSPSWSRCSCRSRRGRSPAGATSGRTCSPRPSHRRARDPDPRRERAWETYVWPHLLRAVSPLLLSRAPGFPRVRPRAVAGCCRAWSPD